MKVKRTGDELKVKIMAVIASAIIQSIMLVFFSHFANGGRLWDTEGNIVPSKPFVKISQNVLYALLTIICLAVFAAIIFNDTRIMNISAVCVCGHLFIAFFWSIAQYIYHDIDDLFHYIVGLITKKLNNGNK